MKHFTLSIALIACVILIACKKERTCVCRYTTTNSTTTTPRSSAQPTTAISTSSGESNDTYNKVKKSDLRRQREINCNSRTISSKDTYTRTVIGYSVASVSGFTYSVPYSYPADVNATETTAYTCEIK